LHHNYKPKKEMKKLLTVLAFALSIASVFAAGSSKIKVSSDSTATFKVYYTNQDAQRVKVTIYNESGKKVFGEIIKNSNGFVRPYNMSELPAGNYTIEVADNQEVKSFEFAYNMQSDNNLTAFVNQYTNNKFLLGLGNGSNDAVTIKILNHKSEVVYTAEEVVANQFAQLFNIETVNGTITFQVLKGNKLIKEISF
jgi:hypothetical protein